ncbi:hypothetical protein AAVH_31096 [Aphelenchoides avenae]|nr:hypothetical protein AAVH_31096 [Aphelenchus avenae]
MMLKKRKLEKRLSSQDRTAGHGSGSLTEAKENINVVLYQDFRATDSLEWWRSEGSANHAGFDIVGKKKRTQESPPG